MAGRECYHCKQWVEDGEAHNCWTTTESALTADAEDLRDAWERLPRRPPSSAISGIYASHNSMMFSRKSCYFFVRPKKSFLEVCVFLGRPLKAPQVRRSAHHPSRSSLTSFSFAIAMRSKRRLPSGFAKRTISRNRSPLVRLERRRAQRPVRGRRSARSVRNAINSRSGFSRSRPRRRPGVAPCATRASARRPAMGRRADRNSRYPAIEAPVAEA